MVDPEFPASRSAAGASRTASVNQHHPSARSICAPSAAIAPKRRLAIRAGRVIGDGRGPFGNRAQHAVTMRNGFVARQRDDSVNGPRGRDRLSHELPVYPLAHGALAGIIMSL